ncbi:MFS transporter [Metarhizium robertsii]|uniref:MFS transporter n=1 Tax=Metarhizium robertsii TaxID=568076 RepID=A0A0A1UVM9_9HYPO|nr:MFS transporter [Metarhizium robertsii]
MTSTREDQENGILCQNPPDGPPLEPREDQALLQQPAIAEWKPPRGFVWIQIALMNNVFLNAFDGTIMAATYAVISSEFDATNSASWLTTAYLIASTAVQPLYGRVSDIFGRRVCFFASTILFAVGSLGCGLSGSMVTLIMMRALTGVGGGGLHIMATIVNSDLIPFRRRGIYQAMQNGVFGLGAICGASLGGNIADRIGWRWCFLLQVPVSVFALIVGSLVVRDQSSSMLLSLDEGLQVMWKRIDFSGALLLVVAVSIQLLGLGLGGNLLPWGSPWVISSLVGSLVLFAVFVVVEGKTSAIPMIPLRMLKGRLPVATQISNACAGCAAYGFLFMVPLFFQVVLLESASKAGARLVIPSLATPIGSVIAGIVMSRYGKLIAMMRIGSILMAVGNALIFSLRFVDSSWKYFAYIFPANLGQGVVYPSILFTSLASFEHEDHAVSTSTVYLIRSLGGVWGVSITSAIVQTSLSVRLPDALGGIPDKWRIIDQIRHSASSIHNLPPEIQMQVRLVYYDGIRCAFAACTVISLIGVVAAFVATASKLRSTH